VAGKVVGRAPGATAADIPLLKLSVTSVGVGVTNVSLDEQPDRAAASGTSSNSARRNDGLISLPHP